MKREEWLNRLGSLREVAEKGMTDKDLYDHLKTATDYFGTEKSPKHWKHGAISVLDNYRTWLNQDLVAAPRIKHKELLNKLFILCDLCGYRFLRGDLAHYFNKPEAAVELAVCISCNREYKKLEKKALDEIYQKIGGN